MDNLTHSLVGATLAELALPADASPAQRRLYFLAGIIGANLPDADLVYTRITPGPLGYLLHHRGHTHTLAGIAGLAALVAAACVVPPLRRTVTLAPRRFAALVAVALLSHLTLDAWNSYGIHPFWPVDNRWFYGDAIYILEPWLWLLLAAAAALNTQRRGGGWLLAALVAALVVAMTAIGMIPAASLAALALVAVAAVVTLRARAPRRRSAAALAAVTAYVVAMFFLRERARSASLAALDARDRAQVLDVALSPQPANPLCWNALVVAADEEAGEYRLMRGTAAPLAARGCGRGRGVVVWNSAVRQSLPTLRALAARDCRVRAWLRFGRAPELRGGAIADARFGGLARDNFSAMPLAPAGGGCPPNLPEWGMPRADLLRSSLASGSAGSSGSSDADQR